MPRRGSKKDGTVHPVTDLVEDAVAPVVKEPVQSSWLVTMVFDDRPVEKKFSVDVINQQKAQGLIAQVIQSGFTVVSADGSVETHYPAHRVLRVELRGPSEKATS